MINPSLSTQEYAVLAGLALLTTLIVGILIGLRLGRKEGHVRGMIEGKSSVFTQIRNLNLKDIPS